MERMNLAVEWKAAADDDGTLEGYASTFGNVDLGGDVINKGAFTDTAKDIKSNGIPLLADHVASTASVLGTIYDAAEDSHGLKIKARFSSAASAQDVRTKLVEGHLNKMSIGYEPVKYSFEDREGKTVRVLEDIKLWETSVVVFPMNPEAAVSRVKCLTEGERKALAGALAEAEQQTSAEADDTQTSSDAPAGIEDAEARHAEAEDTGDVTPAGDDEGPHWDHWRSESLLAGGDPDEIADTATVAALQARLSINESALADDTERSE